MSLLGVEKSCGLVHLGTQPYLFHRHQQYSVPIDITIIITVWWINMVGIILNTWADQWVTSMESMEKKKIMELHNLLKENC